MQRESAAQRGGPPAGLVLRVEVWRFRPNVRLAAGRRWACGQRAQIVLTQQKSTAWALHPKTAAATESDDLRVLPNTHTTLCSAV